MKDVWEKAPTMATGIVAPLINALSRIERADMHTVNSDGMLRTASDPQFLSHATINAFAERPRLVEIPELVDTLMNELATYRHSDKLYGEGTYDIARQRALAVLDIIDEKVLGRPKKLDY
jgi:hypothetical protein